MAALSSAQPSLSPFLQVVAFGGDAEDFKALGGVLVAQLDEPGGFDLAGAAPGGPEVDEHGLAFVAGERDFFAAQVFEREVGGGLVQKRRDVLRHVACGPATSSPLRGGGEARLGGLLAVFPVGPARPGKDGEEEKNGEENEWCCASRG